MVEYFLDRNLNVSELDALIISVGWERRGSELWEDILTYFSEGMVYVRDQERLVGLVRGFPVSEKAFFLGDLIVHEDYQRQGLGIKLLHHLQEQYKNRIFFLEALPEIVPFYENFGFQKVGNNIFGKVPMKLL